LICAFSFDVEKPPGNFLLELIDMQSDNGLKEKFNSVCCGSFFDCCLIPSTAASKTSETRPYQCLRPHKTGEQTTF
jgi:hypothetical protein